MLGLCSSPGGMNRSAGSADVCVFTVVVKSMVAYSVLS